MPLSRCHAGRGRDQGFAGAHDRPGWFCTRACRAGGFGRRQLLNERCRRQAAHDRACPGAIRPAGPSTQRPKSGGLLGSEQRVDQGRFHAGPNDGGTHRFIQFLIDRAASRPGTAQGWTPPARRRGAGADGPRLLMEVSRNAEMLRAGAKAARRRATARRWVLREDDIDRDTGQASELLAAMARLTSTVGIDRMQLTRLPRMRH